MPSEPYTTRGKLGSCRAQFEVKSPSAASRSPREKTSSSHRRTRALFPSGVSISSFVGSLCSSPTPSLYPLGPRASKGGVMLAGNLSLTAFAHLQGHCARPLRVVQDSQPAPLANKRNTRRV